MWQSADSVHEGSRGGRQFDEAYVFLGDAADLALSAWAELRAAFSERLVLVWGGHIFCSTTYTTTLHKTTFPSDAAQPPYS